jgi:hypothetical protein
LERHAIIIKIAEMRSYIASDWPDIEERKSLYKAIKDLEGLLKEDEHKQKKTDEA